MEISIVAGVIGCIVLLVWLSIKLNGYSMQRYNYAPIGISTIILGMIPFVLIIVGFLFIDNSSANFKMAILFASLTIVGLFWWIAHRSSWKVALGAIFILLIVGLPALLMLFLSRDDSYYD